MTADQASRVRAMARWHRRIAILVMAWLAVLAFTGILVNHANDWGLDRRPLAHPLQAWVYGIEPGVADLCSGTSLAGPDCATVFKRIELSAGALLLGETALFLLDGRGLLLEKLGVGQIGLPRLAAAHLDADTLYLGDGETIIRTGTDLLDFDVVTGEEAAALAGTDWLRPSPDTAAITWERLLLDLHAARFLGPFARVFNDVIGGLILLLALSGLWLHRFKSRSNGKRN